MVVASMDKVRLIEVKLEVEAEEVKAVKVEVYARVVELKVNAVGVKVMEVKLKVEAVEVKAVKAEVCVRVTELKANAVGVMVIEVEVKAMKA